VRLLTLPLALAAFALLPGTPPRGPELPIALPNPNTAPAGTLRDSVLTVELDAVEARWHGDGGAVPGSPVFALAERGKKPSIPGPLLRIPAGATIRVNLRNTLVRPLTFFLPISSTRVDSVIVAAGGTGELSVLAAVPGNYIYRATTGPGDLRIRIGGALAGALVVDSAGAPRIPRDRVMVILTTPDSAEDAQLTAGTPLGQTTGGFAFTINGLSWPRTERVALTVGDTVHWRVINASFDVHPMHLHGFYFRVDEFSGLTAERDGQADAGLMVVTERMSPFSAMRMTWSPERAGNWLFHCHFALHLQPPTAPAISDSLPPRVNPHENHAETGMVGLALGISVRPRAGDRLATGPTGARQLRLLVVSDPGFSARRPSQRYVIEEGGRRTAAHPGMSPTLYLKRNQPVAITVVNQMTEYTAVHWHGMELESYFDGVAGLSGEARRLAPMIAPGDSFVARFTPPRSGTFMYHSHVDDARQQRAGLVGAMIVRDDAAFPGPDDYEIFLKGATNSPPGGAALEVGGVTNPDTLVMHAGRPARLRLMSLTITNPGPGVVVTARPDSVAGAVRDSLIATWVPIAKDGADLSEGKRTPRPARQTISMGETYDFLFTPPAAGSRLRLEVRAGGGLGPLLARVPIRVE
jgi:FtsP/CotA-like multicopper oxidase with cupredoxin domain